MEVDHDMMSLGLAHGEDVGVDALPETQYPLISEHILHIKPRLFLKHNTITHPQITKVKDSIDLTRSSLRPASISVSPTSMWPPGGTQMPGNVLMCPALLVSNTCSSQVSTISQSQITRHHRCCSQTYPVLSPPQH